VPIGCARTRLAARPALYWRQPPNYRSRNGLRTGTPMPDWLADLDAEAVEVRCLRAVLAIMHETPADGRRVLGRGQSWTASVRDR
jgi:hypothetical protein